MNNSVTRDSARARFPSVPLDMACSSSWIRDETSDMTGLFDFLLVSAIGGRTAQGTVSLQARHEFFGARAASRLI
jgi:hypothetical protein